jgi:hypothetical protein
VVKEPHGSCVRHCEKRQKKKNRQDIAAMIYVFCIVFIVFGKCGASFFCGPLFVGSGRRVLRVSRSFVTQMQATQSGAAGEEMDWHPPRAIVEDVHALRRGLCGPRSSGVAFWAVAGGFILSIGWARWDRNVILSLATRTRLRLHFGEAMESMRPRVDLGGRISLCVSVVVDRSSAREITSAQVVRINHFA